MLTADANDLALLDRDSRLDTGMTVAEAIRRASAWWDAHGRHSMRDQVARAADDEGFVPSGILQGMAWDYLTRDEKLRIVKVWHHMNVRRPDLMGVDPEAEFMLGRRERVQ